MTFSGSRLRIVVQMDSAKGQSLCLRAHCAWLSKHEMRSVFASDAWVSSSKELSAKSAASPYSS